MSTLTIIVPLLSLLLHGSSADLFDYGALYSYNDLITETQAAVDDFLALVPNISAVFYEFNKTRLNQPMMAVTLWAGTLPLHSPQRRRLVFLPNLVGSELTSANLLPFLIRRVTSIAQAYKLSSPSSPTSVPLQMSGALAATRVDIVLSANPDAYQANFYNTPSIFSTSSVFNQDSDLPTNLQLPASNWTASQWAKLGSNMYWRSTPLAALFHNTGDSTHTGHPNDVWEVGAIASFVNLNPAVFNATSNTTTSNISASPAPAGAPTGDANTTAGPNATSPLAWWNASSAVYDVRTATSAALTRPAIAYGPAEAAAPLTATNQNWHRSVALRLARALQSVNGRDYNSTTSKALSSASLASAVPVSTLTDFIPQVPQRLALNLVMKASLTSATTAGAWSDAAFSALLPEYVVAVFDSALALSQDTTNLGQSGVSGSINLQLQQNYWKMTNVAAFDQDVNGVADVVDQGYSRNRPHPASIPFSNVTVITGGSVFALVLALMCFACICALCCFIYAPCCERCRRRSEKRITDVVDLVASHVPAAGAIGFSFPDAPASRHTTLDLDPQTQPGGGRLEGLG